MAELLPQMEIDSLMNATGDGESDDVPNEELEGGPIFFPLKFRERDYTSDGNGIKVRKDLYNPNIPRRISSNCRTWLDYFNN